MRVMWIVVLIRLLLAGFLVLLYGAAPMPMLSALGWVDTRLD